MKTASKIVLMLILLFAASIALAVPFQKTMIVYKGKSGYKALNQWMKNSFGLVAPIFPEKSVDVSSDHCFLIKQSSDGTVEVSKHMKIKGKDIVVFSSANLHFGKTEHHLPLPVIVKKYFKKGTQKASWRSKLLKKWH